MPPSPQVHVGVSAWVERFEAGHLELLMQERAGTDGHATDGHGRWALPGGWLDHGETEFDTAAREVAEETDLTVDPVKSLGYVLDKSDDGSFTIATILVECRYLGGAPRIMEPDKCAAVEWVPFGQVRERPLFHSLELFLDRSGRI